jgi:peroxiredoxin
MAQLRQDYDKFIEKDAVILVVGPEDQSAFKQYWTKKELPFIGLPDPDHSVSNLYGQQVKWLKAGRMPAMMVIDKAGQIRYQHYGDSMSDIPSNQLILGILDELNQEERIDKGNPSKEPN